MNTFIATTPQPTAPSQPTITLTLESTGIFLGALVSFSVLVAGFTKIVTNFNLINISIKELRQDINANTQALSQLNVLHSEVLKLDKKFDLHLQDYINYKDANLIHLNGLEKQIGHNWIKTEKALAEQKAEIKEIQGFLQKHHFTVRESHL
ncbi:hypothetical protein [Nostoc sp. TCL26-01]|uniref:hypothetical protein n=1 Tax=Nostoc sp. TCL26-01 TaxID=2576904 RepID=UPI0015BC4602|nr:hypothetical protein [Nostoc sp. TCL26-01]QLE55669.1 hypothetical protein FD725_09150 [Nostoc sp. TCL26-01]